MSEGYENDNVAESVEPLDLIKHAQKMVHKNAKETLSQTRQIILLNLLYVPDIIPHALSFVFYFSFSFLCIFSFWWNYLFFEIECCLTPRHAINRFYYLST